MKKLTLACLDVYYYESYAKSCCVVVEIQEKEEKIIGEYAEIVSEVDKYISGEFYKREMPCLIKVLEKVKEDIDFIIVDSFVWLDENKKGLGAKLYEKLQCKTAVIGVAKTYFSGCTNYKEVFRGTSSKPLFVSTAGIELEKATDIIGNLSGKNRIPNILKRVDQLSRGIK